MRSTFAVAVLATFGLSAALASTAGAQDLTRRAVPRKWIEPLVPEDLPELDLKEYIKTDALEKARSEAFAGRYKIALITLLHVKPDADPVEVALVRASALTPLGRRDEAITALSAEKIHDNPRIQVARA